MNRARPSPRAARYRFLPAPTQREGRFLSDALRQETIGGAILLGAAAIAVVWANSPASDAYDALRHFDLGPMSLEHWASDGGLTLFFFIAGLELKRELVVGSLKSPADAIVPVAAAVAGMALPALIYLAVNAGGATDGWAVPMATDIAFALAVLAVAGRGLPGALRAFLLTLAVVDDLGAIIVIAVVFTSALHWLALGGAAVLLVVFAVLQHYRVTGWAVYLPIGLATWWLVLESGVHATIAGVLLGLLTRVRSDPDEDDSPAERLEHRLRPVSAGVAVPLFALMSAGVVFHGGHDLLTDPVVVGIALGLILGKTAGVLGGAWVVAKFTRAELAADVAWRDVSGVAMLSGVGFTVSLLIADLAFSGDQAEAAKTAVLGASLLAGLLGGAALRRRSKHHRAHVNSQRG